MYDKHQAFKIHDRREMLRIKLKSLVAETAIIRSEERRIKGPLREEMHIHRVSTVRSASRSTGIAYGLIRGKTLLQMEPISKTPPDWNSVKTMLRRYGNLNLDVEATIAQGVAVYKEQVLKVA